MSEIPRSEHPRPQFVRQDWRCLNGWWEFEIDPGDTGLERGLLERPLKDRILVPFCPEAPRSGIGHTDFMNAVWYKREIDIPAAWRGNRVVLHFQAVDYDATVWVNGREAGRHRGGFTPFSCDITELAPPGTVAAVAVRARDFTRPPQPLGKQSVQYHNHGCFYTRTTGIWQTVWLEAVPETALLRPRITPDLTHGGFHVEQRFTRVRPGQRIRAILLDAEGAEITRVEHPVGVDPAIKLFLPIPAGQRTLWAPGHPYLYPIALTLLDSSGGPVDQTQSYGGLRSVTIDGKVIRINGAPVFQRLVLDQGFYPDGIWTAPDDADLRRDIELSMAAGFNGARLHQKVFEERFLYHADRLGYLVWGEFGDWGCSHQGPPEDHQQPGQTYITQWLEVLERDYSHPCIAGWCPLNETFQPITDRLRNLDDVTLGLFLATKAVDSTRPVLDASGYAHRVPQADVYDSHDYEQDPARFAERHAGAVDGKPYVNERERMPMSVPYGGQPYFVSEFGGIWWNPDAKPEEDSWGYGDRPRTIEEFYGRFEALCSILLQNPAMFGYCYTQLTDVYQEQNGIFTFNRANKFDLERLRAIQQQPAAIET